MENEKKKHITIFIAKEAIAVVRARAEKEHRRTSDKLRAIVLDWVDRELEEERNDE